MSKETWARMSRKEKAAFVKALSEQPIPNDPFWARLVQSQESKAAIGFALEDAMKHGTGIVQVKGPESLVHIRLGDFWVKAIPEPYYWNLPSWIWKRLTGWRDEYGRKAHLFPFPWFDWNPL